MSNAPRYTIEAIDLECLVPWHTMFILSEHFRFEEVSFLQAVSRKAVVDTACAQSCLLIEAEGKPSLASCKNEPALSHC